MSSSAAAGSPRAPSAADVTADLAQEHYLALQIPPLERQLGARVEHVIISKDGPLSELLAAELRLPRDLILELMRFGAVYYAPVMPRVSDKAPMSAEQLHAAEAARAAGIKAWGPSPKLQVPRRVPLDQSATPGSYARVHLKPKRFPAAYQVDWQERIIYEGPDCVVVDKPAGVQVSPTVDNVLESVPACVAAVLGLPQGSLHGLHRLDAGTSGVVVLGRGGAEFSRWFQELLADKGGGKGGGNSGGKGGGGKGGGACVESGGAGSKEAGAGKGGGPANAAAAPSNGEGSDLGAAAAGAAGGSRGGEAAAAAAAAAAGSKERVRKLYRVATLRRPPLGRLVHHALVEQRGPGEPAHTLMLDEPTEGSAYCELEVLQVESVPLAGAAAAEFGPRAFESTVRLVTGRTHQIRAQLAAVGCVVLGDLLYVAVESRQRALRKQRQQQQQQQQQQQRQSEGQQPAGAPEPAQPSENGTKESGASAGGDYGDGGSGGGGRSTEGGPGGPSSFAVGGDASAWSRAAQADPLRAIALQAALLAVHDPDGRMLQGRAGTGGGVARREGAWVEFSAGTPWWRS